MAVWDDKSSRRKLLQGVWLAIAAWLPVAVLLFGQAVLTAPNRSPKAELFWQLESLIAQGQRDAARQQAAANPNIAKALWQELLLDRLEDALADEPAPISPHIDEVLTLLSEAVPDETLKRLWGLIKQVRQQSNPFSSEAGGLERVMARFTDAAHASKTDERQKTWWEVFRQCRAVGLELGTAISLRRLALAERSADNLALALVYLEQARTLLKQWNHQPKLAVTLNDLGVWAFQRGNYHEAISHFQQALDLVKPLSNKRWQVIYLNNLGTTYKRIRDYEAALQAFQQALELMQTDAVPAHRALVWNNLGDVYRWLGNFDQALSCLQQALDAAKAANDQALQGLILRGLGIVYREKRDIDQALKNFQEVLEICRALNDRLRQAQTLISMGVTLERQGRLTEAQSLHEEALKLAEAIDHKPTQALALLNLGVVYDKKELHEQAITIYQKALEVWEAIEDKWMVALCFKNIGEAHEKLGAKSAGTERERQWEQALGAYRKAVALIEGVRQRAGHETQRAEFMQTAVEPFYRLVSLLAQMNRKEEAFEVSERMRAQALLDALGELEAPTEPPTEKERSRYNELQKRITMLESQISAEVMKPEQNFTRLRELQQTLEEARAELERLRDAWRLRRLLLTSDREQSSPTFPLTHYSLRITHRYLSLPPDTAVLSYIVTEERTWLFVLYEGKGQRAEGIEHRAKGTGQRVESKEQGAEICLELHAIEVPQKELLEDVLWLRENILRQRPIGVTAQRLHTVLIAPALKAIRGKRWLCIIPDGILYSLPFQALQDGTGKYLIERHAIFYTPSLNLLSELQRCPSSLSLHPSSLIWIGLANPKGDASWEPLPYAAQEVQAIARLLSSHHLSPAARHFMGEKATEEAAVKALKESRWAHFATHAVLEPRRPLYSRLILAPDKTHDGVLRAHEVLDLGQISAGMVVLSGCETGQGRILQAEGVLGLAWSFLASGTQTLVVSQWRVNDMSTARLMTAFYRNLLRKSPPGEALRQAQIEMLRNPQFSHPFHWAAFSVMGWAW